MRGTDGWSEGLFRYVSCGARVPTGHPLRLIRAVADEALEALSGEFERLHGQAGRPSVPPGRLPRALLLQAFYSVRSEPQPMERLDCDLKFRRSVGLPMDALVWDASTFSKNRDRLPAGDVAQAFLAAVVVQPRVRALTSDEHFSVGGALIQAWAGQKPLRPKDGGEPSDPPPGGGRNAGADLLDQKRSNEPHASTTDPDARLVRKSDGQSNVLADAGHVLMENRSGLVRPACATRASGTAERDAALGLAGRLRRTSRPRVTLGADRNYDAREHVAALQVRRVALHTACDNHDAKTGKRRRLANDARTTRHPGYAAS
jgi:transposase